MRQIFDIEFDYFSNRKYYVFNKLDSLTKLKAWQIASLARGGVEIAEIGPDLSIPAADGGLIIVRDYAFTDLYQALGRDYRGLNYKLSVKTAEFHSYLELLNLTTNSTIHFGIAPDVKGAVSGNLYARNDSYYDHKYFKGFLKFDPHTNDRPDQASHYVAFYIDEDQAEMVVDIINQQILKSNNQPIYYNMLSLPNLFFSNQHDFFEDGSNCIDFIHDIQREIGIEGPIFADYYRFDELNMLDRGVKYLYYKVNGLSNLAINNIGYIYKYFSLTTTGLKHNAPMFEISYKGWDSEHELVQAIGGASQTELNAFEPYGFSNPLIESIKFGNIMVTQAFLNDPRVNVKVVNINHDNIAHIAVQYDNFEALKMIRKVAPELLEVFNEEKQPPVCFLEDCVNDPKYQSFLIPHKQLMHYAEHFDYI